MNKIVLISVIVFASASIFLFFQKTTFSMNLESKPITSATKNMVWNCLKFHHHPNYMHLIERYHNVHQQFEIKKVINESALSYTFKSES